MSHSERAQEKRTKRSKLTKFQRDKLMRQHFGDRFVYQGRPLMKGMDKRELMKIQEERR